MYKVVLFFTIKLNTRKVHVTHIKIRGESNPFKKYHNKRLRYNKKKANATTKNQNHCVNGFKKKGQSTLRFGNDSIISLTRLRMQCEYLTLATNGRPVNA